MKNLFILTLTILMFTSLLNATDKTDMQYEVPLAGSGFDLQERLISRPADSFVSDQHIAWSISYDQYTARPYIGIGKPAKIEGFKAIDNKNIIEAALNYITNNDDMFHINVEYLSFIRAKDVNGKWYVTFYQKYGELEVLLSEVELRINQKAEVFAFRIQYFDFKEPEQIKLSYGQAVDKAISSVSKKLDKNDVLLSDKNSDKMYILPIRIKNGVQAKRVYKVDYKIKSEPIALTSYVDANSGEILWQFNNVHNYKKKILARGEINSIYSQEPPEVQPFAYQYIKVNGQDYNFDEKGDVEIEFESDQIEITSRLESKYGKIINEFTQNAVYSESFSKDDPIALYWDNSNSHRYERKLYYDFHKIRDWVHNIDPNCNGLEKQIPIKLVNEVQYYEGANAFFSIDGDSIIYVYVNEMTKQMPLVTSILYHEYGHAINHYVYTGEGKSGMINKTAHEGAADAMSALAGDDPVIGHGYDITNPLADIRNIKNNLRYPENLEYDEHLDGRILSGAFWDLREITDLETASKLLHFAKYGLPDDANTGIAFHEWLFEVIVADDDDGDITNGTPHLQEILEAFDKHGIGIEILTKIRFTHTPIDETEIEVGNCNIDFEFDVASIFEINDIKLIYSSDGFETSDKLTIDPVQSGVYNLQIKEFDKPGIWSYYFEAVNPQSGDTYQFFKENNRKMPFTVLIGYKSILKDDFEEETNWVKNENPDFSQGVPIWERVIPNEFSSNMEKKLLRLGFDHSPNGEYCYTTGNSTTDSYVSMGQRNYRELTSPVYNLSELKVPVLSFYYWLKEVTWLNSAIYVDYEIDNSGLWQEVIKVDLYSIDSWENVTCYLPEEISGKNVRFKFTAQIGSLVTILPPIYAMIDDFEILDLAAVSVSEQENPNTALYPNPVHDILNIPDELQLEYSRYEIVDLLGSTVLIGELPSTSLNMQGITSGTYFLRLFDQNNRTIELKFVKE